MMNKIKLTKEEYCILDTIKLFNKFQKIYPQRNFTCDIM